MTVMKTLNSTGEFLGVGRRMVIPPLAHFTRARILFKRAKTNGSGGPTAAGIFPSTFKRVRHSSGIEISPASSEN
jgi:hypothetical protein